MTTTRYTFTVRRDESGVTSTMVYQGTSRDAARKGLEVYLFRTARRGYTIED